MGNVVDSYMRMFLTARNFLGIGLIYIGLGVWLSSEKCFVNKQSTKFLVVYTILFYCVLIGEVTFCYGKKVLDDSSCFVSLPFLAVCFLALSLRIKANFSEHASKKMRRISADFYYLHPALNNYIGTIVFSLVGNYIVRFAVVFALCITFWIITNRSENKFIRAVLP